MDHLATMRRAYDLLSSGDLEHWGLFDAMGMMQQLGALPEGAPA